MSIAQGALCNYVAFSLSFLRTANTPTLILFASRIKTTTCNKAALLSAGAFDQTDGRSAK
eukprot:scaffold248253_cov21-Tisochrysis_lutea.AAC.2